MASNRKVCNRCGVENTHNARKCSACQAQRFAPNWVLAKRPVNRHVGVEITASNPKYGTPEPRITLSKWWPGGRSSFHIPHSGQWEAIEAIINNDLGPILGWKTRRQLLASLKERQKDEKALSQNIHQIVKAQPEFVKQVVKAIKPEKLGEAGVDQVLDILGTLADALTNANAGFRDAFVRIVKSLPKQRQRALEELSGLLEDWSLQQVTSVAQEVRSRIETIELFKRQIKDPRTYEVQGQQSIHRILERAMWLIDERYWLLLSNGTLRSFIGDALIKKDKVRYARLRPDFACGMVGDKLIIIEIKRPSHVLEIDDVNQLETYVTIAEEYKSYRTCAAYLIGNRKSPDLTTRMKHRSSAFQVMTYSDLIDDTEHRYREFLKVVSAADEGQAQVEPDVPKVVPQLSAPGTQGTSHSSSLANL